MLGPGVTQPRLILVLKAIFLRCLQWIITNFDLYLSTPIPTKPKFSRSIKTTVGTEDGVRNVKLHFWTPSNYQTGRYHYASKESGKHPILVNFHGGGFTIGKAVDDARWITSVQSQTESSAPGVFACSVDYSLAPEYPFPCGIEDGVSAILWLWAHADELCLDVTRTALSGFSAGGNMTYTVALRLHQEVEARRAAGTLDPQLAAGRIVSLASFYPSTDWTQTREDRLASNPNNLPGVPPKIYELFDAAYLCPPPDLHNPLLSPACASDQLLVAALPKHMVLVACGGDPLMPEAERFAERLRGLDKSVENMRVQGVGHGWDKLPKLFKGDPKRDEAYEFAIDTLREGWMIEVPKTWA